MWVVMCKRRQAQLHASCTHGPPPCEKKSILAYLWSRAICDTKNAPVTRQSPQVLVWGRQAPSTVDTEPTTGCFGTLRRHYLPHGCDCIQAFLPLLPPFRTQAPSLNAKRPKRAAAQEQWRTATVKCIHPDYWAGRGGGGGRRVWMHQKLNVCLRHATSPVIVAHCGMYKTCSRCGTCR